MNTLWDKLTGRMAGAALLLAAVVASVVFACMGADRALAAMRGMWPRSVLAVFALFCGLAAVRNMIGGGRAAFAARLPAWLFHLGFALVLGGWLYNAVAGMPDGYLKLHARQTGAVDDAFEFALDEFTIDRWADTGAVRQYTSRGRVLPAGGTERGVRGEPVAISVNHPLVKDGWWVYQSSYQEMENPHTGKPFYFTVLNCVKDIGLPYVFVGGVLLLLGAFGSAVRFFRVGGTPCEQPPSSDAPRLGFGRVVRGLYATTFLGTTAMLVHRGLSTGHPPMQNLYEFLMCSAALLPVLTFVSARVDRQDTLRTDAALLALVMIPVGFAMDGEVRRLMPALQSPFFVPHVGAYVLGYLLLVRAAFGAGRRLVGIGFFLLTLGLVLGAAWGKVCWGHWWQFDPKEMWSLATWFVYAAYFHLRPRLSPNAERAFLVAGAVMIVLTLTWINLSRLFTGMHSYA